MSAKTGKNFTISLPNPYSSESGSSQETQKPEAPTRLSILVRKYKHMKHIVPVMAVATVLTLGAWTTLSAEEEKEEAISMSDVPAAVQRHSMMKPPVAKSSVWKRRRVITKL